MLHALAVQDFGILIYMGIAFVPISTLEAWCCSMVQSPACNCSMFVLAQPGMFLCHMGEYTFSCAVLELGLTMSVSWVFLGTHAFQHCMSTRNRVPVVMLGPSP